MRYNIIKPHFPHTSPSSSSPLFALRVVFSENAVVSLCINERRRRRLVTSPGNWKIFRHSHTYYRPAKNLVCSFVRVHVYCIHIILLYSTVPTRFNNIDPPRCRVSGWFAPLMSKPNLRIVEGQDAEYIIYIIIYRFVLFEAVVFNRCAVVMLLGVPRGFESFFFMIIYYN